LKEIIMAGRRTFNFYSFLAFALTGVSLSMAQNATITHLEQTDPSIVYSGTWYTNGSAANSAGSASLTNANGAQAIITFNGTGITWIGVLDPWAGVALVYLDGTLNTVDTYGDTTLYQQALFTARGLPAGPHTLSIEVVHRRDPNGSGSWIWIDGFNIENGSGVTGGIIAGAGRVQQTDPAVTYTGTWFLNTNSVQSGGTAVLATDAGARATFSFNGTGVRWIAYRDEWSGIARVYVDGLLKATVDTYITPEQAQSTAYLIDGLPAGTHTLAIEVTATRNPNSGGSWIWIDAFDVM
jgi:hypothetical protein